MSECIYCWTTSGIHLPKCPLSGAASRSEQSAPKVDEDGCCVVCGRDVNGCYACAAQSPQVGAAVAALNEQWREALLQYEGCAFWIAAEQHSCAKCAPLRALLAEGHDGK